ncbi:MAG: hypothetical protein WKF71_11475 [Pyrinomonadaceae bacterium]
MGSVLPPESSLRFIQLGDGFRVAFLTNINSPQAIVRDPKIRVDFERFVKSGQSLPRRVRRKTKTVLRARW